MRTHQQEEMIAHVQRTRGIVSCLIALGDAPAPLGAMAACVFGSGCLLSDWKQRGAVGAAASRTASAGGAGGAATTATATATAAATAPAPHGVSREDSSEGRKEEREV